MFVSCMPLTTIDYPGKLSCIIFTSGCNLRCPYCHNHKLILNQYPDDWENIYTLLKSRRNILDGVVISGGEPLMSNRDMFIDRLHQIKQLGYSIKLDTNGTLPKILSDVLSTGFIDYAAMDIKTDINNYKHLSISHIDISDSLYKSIEIITNANIAYEFRTTAIYPYVTQTTIDAMGTILKRCNATSWIFQKGIITKDVVLDPTVSMELVDLDKCVNIAKQYILNATKR